MQTLIFTFAVLLLIIAAMSIGVLMGRRPITGSCGGMSAAGVDAVCEICGGNPAKCEEEQERQAKADAVDLAYEVKSKG